MNPREPDKVLTKLIEDCGMKDSEFSADERKRFGLYLECFVTACRSVMRCVYSHSSNSNTIDQLMPLKDCSIQ